MSEARRAMTALTTDELLVLSHALDIAHANETEFYRAYPRTRQDLVSAVREEIDRRRTPHHAIGGRPIDNDTSSPGYNPGIYGRTHDMDCPGCQGTPFLSSPRSETYWCS